MTTKIVITGATGFIGSALCKRLEKLKEYSIIIPPIISIIPFIEEDNGYYKKKTKKNKLDYLNKLTVKRKNPLPTDSYNLMHSMGIKSN